MTALALAAALLTAGPGSPPAPLYGQVVLPSGRALVVEIADTTELLLRGYMFRDRAGPEDGMLLVFPRAAPQGIWMKNVRFPLDILWIAEDGVVVHVEAGVPPCREDPCPDYRPLPLARYVLEVPAGEAGALGLKAGHSLQILLPPPAGSND